jgi:tRNA(fMet)-specific endonuclease VapC
MRAVLLDTDVFSFVFKRDSRAALYAADLAGAQPCRCFQSVAELRLWALARRWGDARCQSLNVSLARCLVLPYDDAMSRHWAEVNAHRRRVGRPIQCGDAWIAPTALRHSLPLLTHNGCDYEEIPGLQLICHADPRKA